MKINPGQLATHLRNELKSLYLVTSEDILLAQEASDAIRAAAKLSDFSERVIISVDANNTWEEQLYSEAHGLSLFAEKRLIELRTSKMSATIGKALAKIIVALPSHILLLIQINKVDSKTQQSAWFKTFDKHGVIVQIWPIAAEALPAWIMQRSKHLNLKMQTNAAVFLASQTEGNLLACAQEIEKLVLLNSDAAITIEDIEQVSSDNAKFDVFTLVDCILIGNTLRSLRILRNLEEEDVDPILALWAITRELRTLACLLEAQAKGENTAQLFTKYRIWDKRKAPVSAFLRRTSVRTCLSLVTAAAQIDRMIKGAEIGQVWLSLENLICVMCGNEKHSHRIG
jgi:DNA polymerase-3 subunit delta